MSVGQLFATQTPADIGLSEEALRVLDANVQAYIDDGDTYGASIIVSRGGVIGHRRTYGTVAPERPAADDDLYLAMSMTKSFTAALVLRAIDQGRFTLDTRIAEILPEYGVWGKQHVTVRQLLNHTGGAFATIIPAPPGITPLDLGDLAKNVAAWSAQPVAYIPGTRSSYSPLAGIGILGYLLVVTDPAGRAYRDIAREDLFEPLGMVDTRIGGPLDDPRRVPISYTEKRSVSASSKTAQLLDAAFNEPAEIPAGNAYTTIDDVFRFVELMRRRGDNGTVRLVSQALFDYAAQNHTGDLSNGAWEHERESRGLPDFPANFSLLGGYVRGSGHYPTGAGFTASPGAIYALGGGSTMWMVDPARDLTVSLLTAGFIDGLAHLERACRINDFALAACVD